MRTARAGEVTSGDVVTYMCDDGTNDGGVFEGNTFFSITCADGCSFSSVSTCSESTFLVVAVARVATTCSRLAELSSLCPAGWRIVLTWSMAPLDVVFLNR